MIAVNTQVLIFLQSLLLGAALGAVYDLWRIFRIAVPLPAGVIVAEDVIYFMFGGFLSFCFAMTVNFGQVRFFILLGEVLGFVVYYFTLGILVMRGAKKIISVLRWILFLLWKCLFRPPILFLRWIGRAFEKLLGKIGKNAKKAVQKHRKHLQNRQILLYNYFKNKLPGREKKRKDQRASQKGTSRGRRGRGKRKKEF